MLPCFDKKRIALFGILLFVQHSFAQITSMRDNQLFLKADNALEHGDYLNALSMYEKLYTMDSVNQEIIFKLGVCNYQLRKYKMTSKKYFDKVNAADFPETWYYLGNLNHLLRNNQLSIENFQSYKNCKEEKDHSAKEVDYLIEKCHTAMLFESQIDNNIQIENLGNTINTEFAEYAPLIPVQEDFIIFTSRRNNPVHTQKDPFGEYFEDIYVSTKFGDSWQYPVMLDTTINTPLHDACTGLSADGEKLFIYRTSKNLQSGDIYESTLDLNKFGTPVILNSNVNSEKYIETSACYTPDNNTIFFSSNRPGGYGGMDLYMMKKLPNGKWATPFNLGPNINTEYNEDAPFVHPGGSVLFFSSEGHKNMGGYDIFKSNFTEDGNFSDPVNLGYPINTRDDDVFFVLNTDATTGYFSSEREGGFGSQDIYKVKFSPNPLPLNVYSAHVIDENNNLIKKAEITITDLSAKTLYGIYKSNDLTGKIIIISEPNKEYQIVVKAVGYEPYVTNIILTSDNDLSYRLTTHMR
jgi:tetratricopeptide (TPR) repeat protein